MVLDHTVTSKEALRKALIASCPDKAEVIEQIFNRY